MQITEVTAAELNGVPLHSLRFRFDERPGDFREFAERGTLTVGPVEFGRGGVGPARAAAPRRLIGITLPAALEFVKPDGESFSLEGISFDVYETPAGGMTFSTAGRPGPWEISISKVPHTNRMTLTCRFTYGGLNVKEALNNLRFLDAMAGGGELRILKSDDRTTLGRARVEEGGFVPTDPRWTKVVGWLVYIQERTGVAINLPDRDLVITPGDAATVYSVVKILETGRATAIAEPWVSVSTPEQARVALETFGSGRPVPMALTYENHVIQLFGTDVPLGPAGFLCRETYITEDDLADLRAALKSAEEGTEINVRFTPFEGCPIEATYRDWLPQGGAAAGEASERAGTRANVSEAAAELPPGDTEAAVALLRSWHDEDPAEQRDTWEKLKVVLGEERLSNRELFP
jgi:hypothetical protein